MVVKVQNDDLTAHIVEELGVQTCSAVQIRYVKVQIMEFLFDLLVPIGNWAFLRSENSDPVHLAHRCEK